MNVERAFILREGLPSESWYAVVLSVAVVARPTASGRASSLRRYKHVISSPSITNEYAGSGFPGVVDALASGDWRLAQRQLDIVCHCIDRAIKIMQPVTPY